MPHFKQSVIDMHENNFDKFSGAGRKRVLITTDNQHFCPDHAKALAPDVQIVSVGYVDPRRKSRSFCVACKAKQTENKTFANPEKNT